MSWNNMRNSFGWGRNKQNGLSFNNPQHQPQQQSAPFPPSSQPFPPQQPTPPGFGQQKRSPWSNVRNSLGWNRSKNNAAFNNQQQSAGFGNQATPPKNTFAPGYNAQPVANNGWSNNFGAAGGQPGELSKKRSLAPSPAQMNPKKSRRVNWVALLVSVFIAVAVVSAIFITTAEEASASNEENESPGDSSPNPPAPPAPTPAPIQPPTDPPPPPANDFELFPVETRSGNDYVGVLFLVDPSIGGGNAFIDAARRWSAILAGSDQILLSNRFLNANSQFCRGSGVFPQTIAVDHLRITATIEPIDGPFNVLGSAGPCAFRGNSVPVFGQMRFDTADIDRMENDNSLIAVILHEMGHVIGIGTIMFQLGVAINQLPGSIPDLNRAQPEYIGPDAVAEFRVLTGQGNSQLFLENGFTGGRSNGAGPGSANGHWDQDSMQVELMTFRIQLTSPALSRVTIAALGDMGYRINIGLADNFALRNNFGFGEDSVFETLVGDTDEIELLDDDSFPEPIFP